MTELPYLAATDAIARFRVRELSPVELMTAVISRAEEVEPATGAFCDQRYERALEAARAAEALERAGLGFGGDPGWRPPEPAGGIGLQGGEGA